LNYLKGTSIVGLLYPSHSLVHLVGYSDSDFADANWTGKEQVELVIYLASSLSFGIARSKPV